jgi:hypothetical protein
VILRAKKKEAFVRELKLNGCLVNYGNDRGLSNLLSFSLLFSV